jgi:2-oxoglutarate ferredoxin oxidoreductase subunit alpha
VIILSDQEIAQRKETVDPIDTSQFRVEERRTPGAGELEDYRRFRFTDSGVSPVSHPGMRGGNYLGSGIEHNEEGAPTASGGTHARMNEKRFRKLRPLRRRRDLFQIEGDSSAPLAVVSWGSSAGVCREAVAKARSEGLQVKLLIPYLLYPVAEDVYREFFASVQSGLVVEQSHQGQLYHLLRMFLNVPAGIQPMARSGANPFLPSEVVARLREVARDLHRFHGQTLQPQE